MSIIILGMIGGGLWWAWSTWPGVQGMATLDQKCRSAQAVKGMLYSLGIVRGSKVFHHVDLYNFVGRMEKIRKNSGG